MFNNRVRELLKMIDYDFWGISDDKLVVEDTRVKRDKQLLEVIELPCNILSDDQDRLIECKNGTSKWMQVSASNISQVGDTTFLKITTNLNNNGNGYYSCEFAEEGALYDMIASRDSHGESLVYRMMDLTQKKLNVTEMIYTDSSITVSRKAPGIDEAISLETNDDIGLISFFKNKELVGTFAIDSSVGHNVDAYYSSVLSTVDNIISRSHEMIYEKNPKLFKMIVNDFPILRRLNKHRNDCYDSDLIDTHLREYDMFIHEDKVCNAK